jgi:hypothetical protein
MEQDHFYFPIQVYVERILVERDRSLVFAKDIAKKKDVLERWHAGS